MGEGSSFERFKAGMSRDLQCVANKIGPVGPRTLQRLSNMDKVGLTRLLIIVSVLLLVFGFWKLPQWYAASWKGMIDAKELVKLESDTRTTTVQTVGGLALLVSLFFTAAKLFFGALILAGGALGDVYGRKRMLLLGVIVVTVASVLSAISAMSRKLIVTS